MKKAVGEGRAVNRRAGVSSSGGALAGKTNGRAATLPAMRQAVAEGAGVARPPDLDFDIFQGHDRRRGGCLGGSVLAWLGPISRWFDRQSRRG